MALDIPFITKEKKKAKHQFEKITFVDASDFPDEVEKYCIDREISIHYDHSVAWIPNNGNPFAEWLKFNGFTDWKSDMDGEGAWIAIFST